MVIDKSLTDLRDDVSTLAYPGGKICNAFHLQDLLSMYNGFE